MKENKNSAHDGRASRRGLGRLLRRYASRALDYAHSLAGNEEDAKELVQQASYQVLCHWEQYDPLQSFQSWYEAIVRNLYLDARRAWAIRRSVTWDAPVTKLEGRTWAETVADGEPGPLEQLERKEQIEAARQALKTLNPEHRVILTSCDLEGASYEEAARKLAIPLGTVRSRLVRARVALRALTARRLA